ncbi:MAG TPA: DUF2330 domain-containing protein, partial [Polyangiaceae bacterium]|nr:DUF2330 domain-containing protein [Polyangiaceae bacterium]
MPSRETAGRRRGLAWALACGLGVLAHASPARAFCGFYVSGADAQLANDATSVVLMREGLRTVLSMENNYRGPPERFALVVPVPVVLQKENVKTLRSQVFRKIDQLSAPRLVEYWEQDPCAPVAFEGAVAMAAVPRPPAPAPGGRGGDFGVKVEAQFSVGEYEIVILSANEAAGLEAWLRKNNYQVPAGAAPYLKPYVAAGSTFFVAKVDPTKVRFEGGQARLSPLRFHYDSDEFRLPVRLGLINSAGTQDLLVHVLARGQRYEVANYPNVTVPTNLEVDAQARDRFGQLYAQLFDALVEKKPGAVVTEYAWDAGSCDPCPLPPLDQAELAALGADVLPPSPSSEATANRPPGGPWFAGPASGFVLTRLHARYGKASLGDDLIFRAAGPISGGRELRPGVDGALEQGAKPDSINNFQARYAIRHPWTGPVECKEPRRGRWGGPPASVAAEARSKGPMAAADLGYVKRQPIDLAALIKQPVPELGPLPSVAPAAAGGNAGSAPSSRGGCAGCHAAPSSATPLGSALAALGAAWLARAKRRSPRGASGGNDGGQD